MAIAKCEAAARQAAALAGPVSIAANRANCLARWKSLDAWLLVCCAAMRLP